jgi:hypothetical protein
VRRRWRGSNPHGGKSTLYRRSEDYKLSLQFATNSNSAANMTPRSDARSEVTLLDWWRVSISRSHSQNTHPILYSTWFKLCCSKARRTMLWRARERPGVRLSDFSDSASSAPPERSKGGYRWRAGVECGPGARLVASPNHFPCKVLASCCLVYQERG